MATLFWILVGLCVLFMLFTNDDKPKGKRKTKKAAVHHGIEGEYTIKGINMSGITDKYLGHHDGVSKAITDNDYDPYAIAVYVGKKRVGWFPAGCIDVHEAIMELGGTMHTHVYIGKATDEDGREFYYGNVRTGV
ncbi:MAG: hypothetical protein IIZ44_02250 [Muribaculaceae bacterium]|nr:hypothetical protein [Muribaculaceae bacterium]